MMKAAISIPHISDSFALLQPEIVGFHTLEPQ